VVKKTSLSPQAELEDRLQYLRSLAESQGKSFEEIYGALDSWIMQLGERSLLLSPIQNQWLYWDAIHETWEPTGVAPGEGEFITEGNRLTCRWKDPSQARRMPVPQPITTSSPAVVISDQLHQQEIQQYTLPPRRRSAFGWIFSFSGLIVSCISLLCGGLSLFYGLTSQPASDEGAQLAQTQVAISSTMTARAFNASSSTSQNTPAGSFPAQTQTAGSSSAAQPATVTASYGNWQAVTCPGSPTTRLAVGRQAYVGDVGGYSLTVFSKAGYDGEELYYLEEGAAMLVIGGPVCLDGQLWWQINVDQGNEGWVPETSQSGQYLVDR
jgi:hypothetical protein